MSDDHRDLHERIRAFWDEDARIYDRVPGHAVSHPAEAAAWRATLRRLLPPPGAAVLDAGAGTGAMSLLAAELGYRVTALDLSPGMLAEARRKALERGLALEAVVGPADRPPPGPFDAVIERHLLWTLSDPVGALAAWRRAASAGRLVVLEGNWSGRDVAARARHGAAATVRRLAGRHDPHGGHHGEYEPELTAALPLASGMSVDAAVDAVVRAGWRAVRIERLRDVEWAARGAAPSRLLGWLETVPRFAVVADA